MRYSTVNIRRMIFTFLHLTILSICISSCISEDIPEIKENFTLIISHESHSFETEGGDLFLKIISTKTITTISEKLITSEIVEVPYTIDISDEWLFFSSEEKKVTAKTNKGEKRTGIITFSIEGTNLTRKLTVSQNDNKKEPQTLIRYVSPTNIGNGDGESINSSADFMNAIFWLKVKNELQTSPVEVKFKEGDYSKAYIENGLTLSEFGNSTHKLTLSGNENVVFNLPVGYTDRSDVIRLNDCQNIHIKNIHFTGDGRTQYALRITGFKTNNIFIENCSWIDMYGIIYGATGCHHKATNITYKDCKFERIGFSGGSHMIYNAYGPERIRITDCYFEDCKGDYIRFRAGTDFGVIQNSTFIRNKNYPDVAFIAIPCFNDVNPGDENFGSNFSFTKNIFKNNSSTNSTKPISFYHQGYSPKEYNYLLTKSEGELLTNGSEEEKIKILKNNFGIDIAKIRIQDNSFSEKITNYITIRSTASYGAISLGWEGTVVISDLIKPSKPAFEWESDWN